MFECAELLERFRRLEHRRPPLDEFEQQFDRVAIHSLMPIKARTHCAIANERDRASRKIERVIVPIDHHLHNIRIGDFSFDDERTRGGNHPHFAIRFQPPRQCPDECGIYQRFITLHIDDVRKAPQLFGDFSDAIGAAAVCGRGHRDFGSEANGRLRNAQIIGRHNHRRDAARAHAPLPDVLNERLARNRVQRLGRQPG
jgi:hypothetical protein